LSARSKARKRAVDLIYAAEMRGDDVADLLELQQQETPVNPYTIELIDGVGGNRETIDRVLETVAEGWTLNRMPAVDRNVLRVAVFEILFSTDVPDAVAITEAVKLVGELSTDESPAFVNGVLASVSRDRESLLLDLLAGAGTDAEEQTGN
jgi:N utilization substance protein B